jgi:hypothetical protein
MSTLTTSETNEKRISYLRDVLPTVQQYYHDFRITEDSILNRRSWGGVPPSSIPIMQNTNDRFQIAYYNSRWYFTYYRYNVYVIVKRFSSIEKRLRKYKQIDEEESQIIEKLNSILNREDFKARRRYNSYYNYSIRSDFFEIIPKNPYETRESMTFNLHLNKMLTTDQIIKIIAIVEGKANFNESI